MKYLAHTAHRHLKELLQLLSFSAVIIVFTLGCIQYAKADNMIYWCNPVNTNWNDSQNWATDPDCTSPSGLSPQSGDVVIITPTAIDPTIDVSSFTNPFSIEIQGGAALTISASSGLAGIATHIIGNPVFDNSLGGYAYLVSGYVIDGNPRFYGIAPYSGSYAYNEGTINGDPIFYESSENTGTINGNPTFENQSVNYGTINGDPIFSVNGQNGSAGIINGNPSFYGSSINYGYILGTDTKFFMSSSNGSGGSVHGVTTFYDSATSESSSYLFDEVTFIGNDSELKSGTYNSASTLIRRYTADGTYTRNFAADNNTWQVIADGVDIIFDSSPTNPSITFSGINNGSIGFSKYAASAEWGTSGESWWADSAHTIPTTAPNTNDYVYIKDNIQMTTQLTSWQGMPRQITLDSGTSIDIDGVNNNGLNTTISGQGDVALRNIYTYLQISGRNITLVNTTVSNIVVDGYLDVYGSSRVNSTAQVTGDLNAYDTSYISEGTVGGNANFRDSSQNGGITVTGILTFMGNYSDYVHAAPTPPSLTRRLYTTSTTTTRDFSSSATGSPWTIVASSNAVVNMCGAITDNTTVTTTQTGGSFTPCDTTPPTISNITTTVTTDTATIAWQTDENATSRIVYSPTSGALTTIQSDLVLKTNHNLTLSGLVPNTTYYYRIVSTDNRNNTATSTERSITTDSLPHSSGSGSSYIAPGSQSAVSGSSMSTAELSMIFGNQTQNATSSQNNIPSTTIPGSNNHTSSTLPTLPESIRNLRNAMTDKYECLFFTQKDYAKFGDQGEQVIKIKRFLNAFQGEHLSLTSDRFDGSVVRAVIKYQEKYKDQILAPFKRTRGTGWWYQYSSRFANIMLGCEI